MSKTRIFQIAKAMARGKRPYLPSSSIVTSIVLLYTPHPTKEERRPVCKKLNVKGYTDAQLKALQKEGDLEVYRWDGYRNQQSGRVAGKDLSQIGYQ